MWPFNCGKCQEKDTEISTLKGSVKVQEALVQQRNTSIQQRDTTISQLRNEQNNQQGTINTLRNQIRELETNEARRLQAITELTTTDTQNQQKITDCVNRISELEAKDSENTRMISILNAQVSEANNRNTELKAKETDTAKLLSELESRFQQKEQEIIEKDKRIKELQGISSLIEEVKISNRKGDDLPSLSIEMDSVLSLNDPNKGWKILQNNTQGIKSKKMITVGVLGMYDVGKSWFINEFTDSKQCASGYSQTTNSLNFIFPTEEGNLIGLIDTPGSNEAIRVTDEELLAKVGLTDPPKAESEHDADLIRYKYLKNDAKILQDFKERFITEVADVVILICNKMSDKEQEAVFKMVKNYFAILKIRQDKTIKNYKKGRDTQLLIVHNYKNLSEKAQVEAQLEKDLKKSFRIQEEEMFNISKSEYKNCNQTMFKDQFGVNHVLLAAKDTPAGKYYNESTFGYIKQVLSTMDNRTPTDVAKSFYEFCRSNIPGFLKKKELKFEYDEDRQVIYKNPESQDIVLENMQYDELGNWSISTFEPKYSIIQKTVSDEEEELTIEVEVIDSVIKASIDKGRGEDEGSFLRIVGTKNVPEEGDCTREGGKFDIKIPISADKEIIKYTRTPEKDKGTHNGIVTFTFTLGHVPPPEL